MEGPLKDKTVLITGSGRGIGKQTAKFLAREGAKVAVCARTESEISGVVKEIKDEGFVANAFKADISRPEQISKLVDRVRSEFSRIDILINNAAAFGSKPVVEMTYDEWKRIIETNLNAVFLLTKEVLPEMINRKDGDIVFLSSTAGKRGYPGGSAYSASKHAINGFAHSLLYEVRVHNIRVITVSPSAVDTEERGPMRDHRLQQGDIAEAIVDALKMNRRAFIRDVEVWCTNPGGK